MVEDAQKNLGGERPLRRMSGIMQVTGEAKCDSGARARATRVGRRQNLEIVPLTRSNDVR